jgi:regulation of enolase protein 1 (concanavalin A-like superfamily)
LGVPTVVNMTASAFVGLAVTSHNVANTCTAVFENVTAAFWPPNTPPTAAITSPATGAAFSDPPSIPIAASASDAEGTVAEVAFYDGATLLGVDSAPPFTYNWASPPAGAHSLTVRATDGGGLVTTSAAVNVNVTVTGTTLGLPWQQADVGAVGLAGNATASAGVFTIQGSGSDVFGLTDQFHFVYRTLSGDGEIRARVASIENTHNYAKAGVMIRQSLTPNSPYALMEILARKSSGFQWRLTTGGTTLSVGSIGAAPYWVRLVRTGTTLTASRSSDGITWTDVGSATIAMGTDVFVGLAVTSHNNGALCTATFDTVTVN